MYFRLTIVWVTAAILSTPVMGGNVGEETVIDPKSGEVIAIHAKTNEDGLQEVIESTKLCLDNQTVQEIRVDGTVICYDAATGSISNYLNIEMKSDQSMTSVKAFETSGKTSSPCPSGWALEKIEIGGRIECVPL